ncbi:unnamed protein product [Fusarium venenatum]|uniref:Uncharacterized protein n=1 Tax=Fusarium venenatum TaxID=56646 RepID=A0A2L2THS9_9HYPO|nr:uncharacterized protein FVRRES_13803 [Fusarium venenatum]CEI41916.1 unnamed protein product [Fusarium venenatum]
MGKRFIDAGVKHVMTKSAGITKDVRRWRRDAIRQIEKLRQNNDIFESLNLMALDWQMREIAIDVNLSIGHSQTVQRSSLREGNIWWQLNIFFVLGG